MYDFVINLGGCSIFSGCSILSEPPPPRPSYLRKVAYPKQWKNWNSILELCLNSLKRVIYSKYKLKLKKALQLPSFVCILFSTYFLSDIVYSMLRKPWL